MMNFIRVILPVLLVALLPTYSCNQDSVTTPSGNNGSIYYIDSETGSDDNNGTSPESAWKSLDKINDTRLKPGNQVLFKAGTVYNGQLVPQGSGSEEYPVIIDKYGEGDKPRINGGGNFAETLLLYNVEYYEVSNLEITNRGVLREAGRKGVHVRVEGFGVAHHIYLRNLYIHDVNGSNVKADGGGYGIHFSCSGSNARFHDLLIENNHLVRCDRNGITGWSDYCYPGGNWNPSTNVVIRGNLLEDIGGDGIVPIGTDGCLVEYNKLEGGRMRAEDWAAGMWPWGAVNTVIQFNEVSGMKGTKDGQAFDSDYECSGTIIQYNYSHDNDGGFLLVCSPARSSYGNRNSIIRYNISQNDGSNSRIFHITGGSTTNTKIYNNTIYSNLDNYLIRLDDWEGYPDETWFYNNIFFISGSASYSWGEATNTIFENNVFFGNHNNPPAGNNTITENPLLVNPGSGGDGFSSLEGYKLQDGSPCTGSGIIVSDNGGRDFFGNPVPESFPPSLGAHQK
jgi:hypothetical protein